MLTIKSKISKLQSLKSQSSRSRVRDKGGETDLSFKGIEKIVMGGLDYVG